MTATTAKKAAPTPKRPAAKKPAAQTDVVQKPPVKKVKGGREVTLHGVTVTVLDDALGDFETTDDLSLLTEAFTAIQGREVDDLTADEEELAKEAQARVPGLIRRLVGLSASKEVYRAIRRENEGSLDLGDVVGFINDLFEALSPNS